MNTIKIDTTKLDKLDEIISAYTRVRINYAMALGNLGAMLPDLTKKLNKLGLEVVAVRHSKTGLDAHIWDMDTKLSITVETKPIALDSFKYFVGDRGYDASGRSKNRAARESNENKLKERLGVTSVSGLEFKNNDDLAAKTVRFSFYVEA